MLFSDNVVRFIDTIGMNAVFKLCSAVYTACHEIAHRPFYLSALGPPAQATRTQPVSLSFHSCSGHRPLGASLLKPGHNIG